MPGTMRKTHDKSSDAGTSNRRSGEEKSQGASAEKKMLINDERSQYMYENKQNYDNLSATKDEISA